MNETKAVVVLIGRTTKSNINGVTVLVPWINNNPYTKREVIKQAMYQRWSYCLVIQEHRCIMASTDDASAIYLTLQCNLASRYNEELLQLCKNVDLIYDDPTSAQFTVEQIATEANNFSFCDELRKEQ
jgi:hypothetical protein